MTRVRLRHFYPLGGYLVPTLIMGYGIVIPRSCIAGVNELTIGFAASLFGAALSYVVGLRALLADLDGESSRAPS